MAAVAHGDPRLYLGMSPATVTMYNASGTDISATNAYVTPQMTEADVTVGFEVSEHQNIAGEIAHRRCKGEYLEATFQFVPADTGVTPTTADAVKSATLPGKGFSFAISGMKAIPMGGFADAFNCTSTTSPWFVQPGAGIRGPSQEMATVTVTARRYSGITSNTPVSE